MASDKMDLRARTGRRRNTGAVTIRDVARLADVAPITVSRAIRSPDTVTPPVMARIAEAIRVTGYIPNAVAGALSSGDSRLVAAVVPTISTLTLHPMLEALTNALSVAGYQLMLGQEGYGREQEDGLLRAILARKPTGIVLTGARTAETSRRLLKSAGIPIVEVWNIPDDPIDMSVGFSHAGVAQAVVDYLHKKNRTRLVILTGDDVSSSIRVAAARERALQLGLAEPYLLRFPAPSTLGDGRQALSRLVNEKVAFDSIFCASDLLAQGVLIEARVLGLDVPGKVSVVGCGDAVFAKDLDPSLSSVWFDSARIGRIAAEFILARVQGYPIPETKVDVGFRIIERAST